MKRWVQFVFLLLVAVTALGSNGLASPFAPEAAYNAYGGSVERLGQRLPLFYGGQDQSLTYQVTYGTLSAATVFIGSEFGQAGRLGRTGVWTAETKLAAEVAQKTAESAAKSGGGRIVLGENMERVRAAAKRLGAETFEGTGMEANRAWVQMKRAQGYEVYDIGPDFARRAQRAEQGIRPDSPFYNMERMEMKGYENYFKLFERSGKYKGGTPGIDY